MKEHYNWGQRVLKVILTFALVLGMFAALLTDSTNTYAVSSSDRHVVITYTRTDGKYSSTNGNWNFWVWEVGGGEGASYAGTVKGGSLVVDVKVSADTTQIGYVIRKSTSAEPWAEKDGDADRFIDIPATQNVVKVSIAQGKDPVADAPYNIGYETTATSGTVNFYYRDDTKYYSDTLSSLNGKVSIEIDGKSYAMTYSSTDKRFVYKAAGLSEGKHYYRYIVNGTAKTDNFNTLSATYGGNKCSYINYEKPGIKATLSTASASYNDNVVITVKANVGDVDVKTLTADLTAIGGPSAFEFDTALMKATVGIKDTVSKGTKNIPIKLTTTTGKVYSTTASITVTDRTYSSSNDFDWDEAIIYFMLTDRFNDGNTANNTANGSSVYNKNNAGLYHGGDFAGITKKLDYLENLGINTIWISPVVDNVPSTTVSGNADVKLYSSYHGYWARDFEKLNPNFGTEAEFNTLINEAHKRGIKIMLDVVLNHAGYGTTNSPIFSGMFRQKDEGGSILTSLSGLPDFKTEEEFVRNKLIDWQTAWMENYDIDYFRVDTVINVDTTTWKSFKNALTESNPSFKMIGEYWGASYSNTGGNLGTGSMDSLLDFGFKTITRNFINNALSSKVSLASAESQLETRNKALNNTATMGNFLSSHDEEGFYYALQKSFKDDAKGLMEVASTIQITAKGQPIIYYGEELGQTGDCTYPTYNNRYDLNWSIANSNNEIYNHYTTMLNIRKNYSKIFAKGDRKQVAVSDEDGYLVFSRNYEGKSVVVGINTRNASKTVSISTPWAAGTQLIDMYNSKVYTVGSDKKVSLNIPASGDGGTAVLAILDGTKVTVKFSGNGGTVSESSKIVVVGGSSNGTYGVLPTVKRNGYKFLGWYTSATAGSKVTSATTVTNKSTHTLYAHWSAITYTVKLNANGGSVKTTSLKINYYKAIGTLPTPVRKGYTFKGWYTSTTFATKVTSTSSYKWTSDKTFYAKWSANTYKTTLDANGGKISGLGTKTTSKTVTFAKTYGTLKNANRAGYAFKGWYTSKTSGIRITSGTKVTYAGNRTLYARWSKVTAAAKVSISSISSSSAGKFTVKLKAVSSVAGYEIRYSRHSNFTNSTSVRTTKTSYTISKLGSGKKYYVKVRAYRLDSKGQRIYGSYGSTKTVTTK